MSVIERAKARALIEDAKSLGVYDESDIQLTASWMTDAEGMADAKATIADARKLMALGLMTADRVAA